MKILHYAWGAYNDRILYEKLVSLGFEVVSYSRKCTNYTRDMELAAELIGLINENRIEAVISFDYFPIITMATNVCNVMYYSWVYDSPHLTLQAKCVNLQNNVIGVFDKELVNKLNANDITTVHYTPLPVDTAWFDCSVSECERDYTSDISFVGSMYTDSHNYYDELRNKDKQWGLIDCFVNKQKFEYNNNYESELLTTICNGETVLDYLKKRMANAGNVLDEDYIECQEDIIIDYILRRSVTVAERKELLTRIAEYSSDNKYKLKLYTGSDVSKYNSLERIKCKPVDYLAEMPKVFRCSKININITLRTIRSGIPLRALDIMASGGFLLTNPQSELSEYLVENEDYVAFYSVDDCLEKINFYLEHDEIREQIALNGYRKASEAFSYEKGLERLLDTNN